MNRTSYLVTGIINFVLAVVEVLLGLRVIFRLLGASAASGFTNFVYSTTSGLVSPFQGIVATQASTRGVIDWSAIIAMIVYALIAWLLVALVHWIGTSMYAYPADRTTVIRK